jgi:hypothetical protein
MTSDTTKQPIFGRDDVLPFSQTVVSAWAFIGLLVAIFLQQDDLEHQGKAIQEQQKVMDAQLQSMRRQAFESGFYQLLAAFERARNSVEFTGPKQPLTGEIPIWNGANAFEALWAVIRTGCREDATVHTEAFNVPLIQLFEEEDRPDWTAALRPGVPRTQALTSRISVLQQTHLNRAISVYLRLLLVLLDQISETDFTPDEKLRYRTVVMATMTRDELLITIYYTFGLEVDNPYLPVLWDSTILEAAAGNQFAAKGDFELAMARLRLAAEARKLGPGPG